ncbi:amine sulfotransferase-like [Bolinopsis microptera]|uniref:amine sulfotransferase-like n=1 Tax=Bolinopsis microptera TaxID=2820187 RepID=UPI0030793479
MDWNMPIKRLFPPLNLPFRHNFLCGQIYPPLIDGNEIHRTSNYELRDDDVILVTYPKSGTLWVQQILKCLYERNGVNKDSRISLRNNLSQAVPWIELLDIEEFNAMTSPRVMTTHETYNNLAWRPGTKTKYIYLTRNPKDVLVSYFHHMSGYRAYEYNEPLSQFVELFTKGKLPYGSWFGHTLDYFENLNNMDIFHIDYESLHLNFEKIVMKLNRFLGLRNLSNEDLESIKERCAFNRMKVDSNANMSRFEHRRKPNSADFLRQGKVGDWENHLSAEECSSVDRVTNSFFDKTTKKFIYNLD